MDYRIGYLDAAQIEIDNAYLWVVAHSPHRAAEWFAGLIAAVDSLFQMPYGYMEMPMFGVGVWRLLHEKFLILYVVIEPENDEIEGIVRVMHVFHGARAITNP